MNTTVIQSAVFAISLATSSADKNNSAIDSQKYIDNKLSLEPAKVIMIEEKFMSKNEVDKGLEEVDNFEGVFFSLVDSSIEGWLK